MEYEELMREKQRLERALLELARRVEHEASEAKMCLEGDPNLPMCAGRIENILKAARRHVE